MTRFQPLVACMIAASTGLMAAAPSYAEAQTKQQLDRRQQKKNEWRNLAYVGGGLALLGLLNKNTTLTSLGVVGALYSAHRYEQDRKSQSSMQRSRAQLFSRTSFVSNGVRYNRKTIWKNGQRYYTFVRAR
ncbi:MAG: hypothetical protein ACAH95_01580 [Fimbriimonas sp.]